MTAPQLTFSAGLKSKLPDVGTTIFTTMSQMAQQYNALNLSQGFPAFDPPAFLTERLVHHLKHSTNQYAPMAGVPALREALSEKAVMLYGAAYNPETEITITSGATEALFCAISSVVGIGDEVIVIEPAYDSYAPAIRLCGGIPVYLTLESPDFCMDWEQLARLISPKTRLIIINTPNNPTGLVWEKSDLDRLAALVRGTGIFVISDEVYEHIVFDGAHFSVMMHEELAPRAFVIGSFGKTFHITGWKVGYCYAPEGLTCEFRKVHQFLTFSVSVTAQFALADILLREKAHYLGLSAFYEHKRNLFNDCLKQTRFRFTPAKGTFFQTVSFEGLTDETDRELVERLTRETQVAAIPVSAFYRHPKGGKMIRFCFAKDDDTLLAAGERLCKIQW
ncbi:pyridoxal phosphate-dependent aminotransferase [Ravibacter arvi]|uniref:Pyridoxal phosphate-dependent aminotransferase n=1 Tax=Ravibacter arvi TaxID=2051041 RepID=A0ABP8M457_9BACT